MNEEMMSKNDWKQTIKENWYTEVTINLILCTKATGDNMKMNEHGCVSMKLYQKRQQPVDCGPLNYVTHVKELLN